MEIVLIPICPGFLPQKPRAMETFLKLRAGGKAKEERPVDR